MRRENSRGVAIRSLRTLGRRPWLVTIGAAVGLLFAIILVGLVALFANQRVENITEEAIEYDVELEDRGDDLRVSILDLRDFHRNLVFAGPSRGGIENFEDAYDQVLREVDELEDLGVRSPEAPQPDELRRMAREYYETFRPAIELYDRGTEAGGEEFTEQSDEALLMLAELESAAQEIDKLGEQQAEASLRGVERAADIQRLVLLLVNGGLILVGAVLAYSVVRAVRELRRLYARERESSEALARASQAKTDFLADVSHELRTPLTVLQGNAEIGRSLDGESADKETYGEIFDDILKESERMSRMVDDLLFLARSDSDSLPLEKEWIEAASFLAELSGQAQVLARERGVIFHTNISGEGRLEADPARLGQAVMVLLDNATKYSPPRSVVTLSSATEPGELCIEVTDEGPGIPADKLPHIFERFYRADKGRSRKKGGSGLGLSIAKTIVEAHGGRIEAESRAGEGTKMKLHLPLSGIASHTDKFL